MRLPALLPEELSYTKVAESDRALFNLLVKIPSDFIVFFEFACEDETWGTEHRDFLKMMLEWATQQYFQDKVETDYAINMLKTIRKHFGLLDELIPRDIYFIIENLALPANSLMWGASSEWLHQFIRREGRDKDSHKLTLPAIPREVFDLLEEFVQKGELYHLTTKSQNQILKLIDHALSLELTDLVHQAETALKKYIDKENVFDLLILAQKKHLTTLRQVCFDLVNSSDNGVFFKKSDIHSLVLGFYNFREKALSIFNRVLPYLTTLAFPDQVSQQDGFREVLQKSSNIRGIDLTLSLDWSEDFLGLPSKIRELNLSQCSWLTAERMAALFTRYPAIEVLALKNNSHLNYRCWPQLQNLKGLDSLDIAHCSRLNDEEFKLILAACKNIRQLNLESCSSISEQGFIALSQYLKQLVKLNLSHTKVTDAALLAIAQNCSTLSFLNVSHCPALTPSSLSQIKKLRPFIKIAARELGSAAES